MSNESRLIGPVADAHVDVLYRLEKEGLDFYGPSELQASAERLLASGVSTQVFALYVSPAYPPEYQLELALRQIDLFYERVVQPGVVRAITTAEDLVAARAQGEIAGILSLEGGGCLRGRLDLLRNLYRLGVRGIGLTWNDANELADGCGESRGGGLTSVGAQMVQEAARLGMWVDLSHLADKGVYDIFDLNVPYVMASHSNARTVHEHRRNLPDDVIRELIRRKGWMGLVFEGSFVADAEEVSVEKLLGHLDYVLELGGEDIVGFGSDFDGATNMIPGLAHAGDYAAFRELIWSRYGTQLGNKILFENFERFLGRVLCS